MLQPCDVGVFGPFIAAYGEEAERLYRNGSATVDKEHFTLLYDRVRRKVFICRNILTAWVKTGLRPLNPHKVLDAMCGPLQTVTASHRSL